MDTDKIKSAIRDILIALGENPEREGLKNTPKRVARMYEQIFSSIGLDTSMHLDLEFTQEMYDELLLIRDIPVYSVCEHHMVPFFGKAHVAYIPDGKITGLSKIVRTVDAVSKKLQLQERMTLEIADCIMDKLKPKGVVVVIECEHLCISMRGIKKPGALTITSAVRGIFKEDSKTRAEAFSLIRKD